MKKMMTALKNRILCTLIIMEYRDKLFHTKREDHLYLQALNYLSKKTNRTKYWILLASYFRDRGRYDKAILCLEAAKSGNKAQNYLWECRKERVSLMHNRRYDRLLLGA